MGKSRAASGATSPSGFASHPPRKRDADCPTGPSERSNPAQGGEGGEVLAMGVARVAVVGDLVGPLGAVALGRAVGEPAGEVGAVLERGVGPGQPPLDRRQLGARDALEAVRAAGDHDQHRAGQSAPRAVAAFVLACGGSSPPPANATSSTTTSTSTPATTATPGVDLTLGHPAPDFTSTDQDGKPVHLADLKGHPVVVYFYPKDETPGCTHEACSFRDAWVELQKKGVVIIGISTDTADSHKAFAKNHQLPFILVSDPKGEIAAKYGVPIETENGESYMHRESFVIAPDGTLKKIYRKVDVKVHAQEIAGDTAS